MDGWECVWIGGNVWMDGSVCKLMEVCVDGKANTHITGQTHTSKCKNTHPKANTHIPR